jgi:hypothetical protein
VSSDADTPQKQAEQIMAIFPILPGQVSRERSIPPRHVSTAQSDTAQKPLSDNKGGDLIDFGQNDASAPAQAERPSKIEKHPSSDIPNLLESTGQKVDGPLLDFTRDLKKDLPSEKAAVPSSVKRADTEESNDNFFDAEE